MSLVAKIAIPVVIIGGLIWLYMSKYPSMVAQTQTPTTQEPVKEKPVPVAEIKTDAQLTADLISIDAEMTTANDASVDAQSVTDTPVSQTE